MRSHDVYVTGVALVAPMAMDANALFARLANKQSCLRDHPGFAKLGFSNCAAGYLDEGQWRAIREARLQDDQELPRQCLLVEHVARQALAHAGLERSAFARAASGVFLGSNKHCADSTALESLSRFMDAEACVDFDAYLSAAGKAGSPFSYRVDQPTVHLASLLDVREHVSTHADACAAGTIAIGSAYRAIERGEIDLAICGAVELMANELPYYSFNNLGALCQRSEWPAAQQSRPFMNDRCGFVMSEGAALLVLESRRHAEQRKAVSRGQVLGYANFCEAQKITSSSRDGSLYEQCMEAAIEDAGLPLAAIQHVNVHGTSTQSNDRCEALALKRLFGPLLPKVSITANKSALGHSLAGSGAIEAVLSLLSLEHGTVLPTLNYDPQGAEFPELNIPTDVLRQSINVVLSNSFGFGGINSSLVLGRA
ncbi:beta-ketoacyl-[acyl-carrier-protein] synthase family protein [Pseudomonas sp. HLS-6 TE3448]|jgi:3-oxoacyl-[acyl-carrier-protein] synthase II